MLQKCQIFLQVQTSENSVQKYKGHVASQSGAQSTKVTLHLESAKVRQRYKGHDHSRAEM